MWFYFLLVVFRSNYARFDAAEDGYNKDVDGKHEETTLNPHHDLLPGDF